MQPNKTVTNEQRIIDALQWNEQQYANFIYENGIAYLEYYIPADAHGIEMLTRSKTFWNWWKNHWRQRDVQFLSIFDEASHAKTLERLYRAVHNPLTLINEIYPNAVVLSESYAVMIENFHQEKTEA